MKDKYTITSRWQKRIEDMKIKAEYKFNILLQNKKRRIEKNWEYEIEKNERKKQAYINKKEGEYKRKMLNEIREMEWKPKREYKTDAPKIKPLQFAMDIAQENAKLRDTDADGNGRCISCNTFCSWQNLAGWHRYSRRFQTMCLEPENINAQCHTCNYTTWPKGDTVAKERVNNEYDINIDKKFWAWTTDKLKKKVTEYFQGTAEKYDLDYEIPRLIEENKRLWETKNFYKPKRNRHGTRTKYKNRT